MKNKKYNQLKHTEKKYIGADYFFQRALKLKTGWFN